MLSFSIKGIDYECPNTPEEITYSEFLELARVERNAPAKLKGVWGAVNETERNAILKTITDIEYHKDFVPYFLAWLHCLTKISKDVFQQCPSDVIENLYGHLHACFDMPKSMEPKTEIEHEGRVWFLPAELMQNSTVGEYSAAANLQEMAQKNEGSYVFALGKICAILLREAKDAPFQDANLGNEKHFASMAMDKVWAVCFFLTKRVQHLSEVIQIFLQVEAQGAKTI